MGCLLFFCLYKCKCRTKNFLNYLILMMFLLLNAIGDRTETP